VQQVEFGLFCFPTPKSGRSGSPVPSPEITPMWAGSSNNTPNHCSFHAVHGDKTVAPSGERKSACGFMHSALSSVGMSTGNSLQETQLPQRDRAIAAWVGCGQSITERGYSAPNLTGLSSTTVR